MDWNLFWAAFSTMGITIGLVITATAVVVAVVQYKQLLINNYYLINYCISDI